jgi:hypothetical protein
MSDPELQNLADDWNSLVPEAQNALSAEFAARNIPLHASERTEEDPPEYRNLTTVRRYRDLSEAIVARGVVESAGIFCFLQDENLVRLDWQVSNFIGGIRLQVDAADVEAAEAILSQPIPNFINLPDQPTFDQPRCPRCNSSDITWERQGRKAALASLYLFSLPSPRGSESWTCNKCNLRWTDDNEHPSVSSN